MKSSIAVISNEGKFCMNIASISSSIPFDIIFLERHRDIVDLNTECAIIDLNDRDIRPFDIVKGNYVLVGVMNKLNKKIEMKSRDVGYDITFTKKMFLINFTTIIKQLANV
tara:strand:+ start:55 stop:387 length:333 start_codon:yes stop_codon:yes gene_type:complete